MCFFKEMDTVLNFETHTYGDSLGWYDQNND